MGPQAHNLCEVNNPCHFLEWLLCICLYIYIKNHIHTYMFTGWNQVRLSKSLITDCTVLGYPHFSWKKKKDLSQTVHSFLYHSSLLRANRIMGKLFLNVWHTWNWCQCCRSVRFHWLDSTDCTFSRTVQLTTPRDDKETILNEWCEMFSFMHHQQFLSLNRVLIKSQGLKYSLG